MKRPHGLTMNLLSGRTAALWILCVLFLTGSIAGCMTAGLFRAEDRTTLLGQLNKYLTQLQNGLAPVQYWIVAWRVVRVPLAAFLLGITALGIIGLPVLFVVRGFCFAYAVAILYRLQGLNGLVLGVCLFGVSAVFWLPGLLELGVTGLNGAYGLLRRVTGDGRYPLDASKRAYWLRCSLCAVPLLVCVAIECMLLPVLVRLIF